MALDWSREGEEPEPDSHNGLHVHLIEFTCEELWALADDSEDEHAEAYDELAEEMMTTGTTPLNKDLMQWLQNTLPVHVYAKVWDEAQRVQWPFMTASASVKGPSHAIPVEEPMCQHEKCAQLQEVIKDGLKASRRDRKSRRVSTEQKASDDTLVTQLIEEVGNLRETSFPACVVRALLCGSQAKGVLGCNTPKP